MIVLRSVLHTDGGVLAAQTDPEDPNRPVGIAFVVDEGDIDGYYAWPDRTELRGWCQWVLAQLDAAEESAA